MKLNIPKIDGRDERDILKEVKELARQYVPEWDYNEKDPDMGVVFSKIFASMFEDTIISYNRTPYNHYISFLNLLGAKLMPPIASTGMVTVSVVPDSGGVYIDKGTRLYASSNSESGRVAYETEDSLYALDTRIEGILFTDAKKDTIMKVYDREDSVESEGSEKEQGLKPFRLFDDVSYENIQSHVVYFDDEVIFKTEDRSDIILQFYNVKSQKREEILPDMFSDKDNVIWQYYKDEEWHNIESFEKFKNGVRLIFGSGNDVCEVMDIESRFIRCVFKKIPKDGLWLTGVECASQATDLEADSLIADTTELSNEDFFPFGEQFSPFTDFYFSSDEAFSKKGSKVKINIDMQFIKVKINTDFITDNINYRYIMSDLDFQTPEPSDIEIERVVWEYWNGVGWAKLYPGHTNEDFFMARAGDDGRKEMSFICPGDMESTVVGAKDSYYIRARIKKVKNQFNIQGNYITPYIHKLSINYDYGKSFCRCKRILTRSNMTDSVKYLYGDDMQPLLKEELCKDPSMYICLNKPLINGPVRILFDIEKSLFKENPALRWEYCAKGKSGGYEWKSIEVLDSTDNFSHNAIVSLIGRNDFAKITLFEKEGYFLRVVNHDGKYSRSRNVSLHPIINGIYFNTVQVVQKETEGFEYYTMENGKENKICRLSNPSVSDVEVWVNEFGKITVNEQESLMELSEDKVLAKYDSKGNLESFWIRWDEIASVVCADPGQRVFEVDYNKGLVTFGDGKHGKIPSYQPNASIKIRYSVSKGKEGNIQEQSVAGFLDSVPYIDKVINLKPMVGGVDMETVDCSARRMASEISGMRRIVSLDDFEQAIHYYDRNIYRVKCCAHIDELGKESKGVISVAVLPINYMQGYEKFLVIKNRVEEFIKDRATLTLSNTSKIKVFEAMYVEMSISVDVIVNDYNSYQSVYQEIYERLQKFLDPIEGNFDGSGWNIGQLPRKEIIYNYIKNVKDIKWIRGINLFTKIVTEEGKKEVDFDKIKDSYFAVPVFGEPEINISID